VAEIQSINYPLHPSRLAHGWLRSTLILIVANSCSCNGCFAHRQFSARRTICPASGMRDCRGMTGILPQTQGSSTTANRLDYRPLR